MTEYVTAKSQLCDRLKKFHSDGSIEYSLLVRGVFSLAAGGVPDTERSDCSPCCATAGVPGTDDDVRCSCKISMLSS